jgi:hypothetical protein
MTPPENPLTRPSPHRALLEDLHEQVVAGLEKAQAVQEAARERMAAAEAGASGEALDGAVTVRVDSKGLVQSAEFGPEVVGLSAEELRGETLAALEAAKAGLGLRPRMSAQAVDALFDRPVAEALLRLLKTEEKR